MHITRKWFYFIFCFRSDLRLYMQKIHMTNLLTPLCCTSVIFSAESKWDEMEKKIQKVCYVTKQYYVYVSTCQLLCKFLNPVISLKTQDFVTVCTIWSTKPRLTKTCLMFSIRKTKCSVFTLSVNWGTWTYNETVHVHRFSKTVLMKWMIKTNLIHILNGIKT